MNQLIWNQIVGMAFMAFCWVLIMAVNWLGNQAVAQFGSIIGLGILVVAVGGFLPQIFGSIINGNRGGGGDGE